MRSGVTSVCKRARVCVRERVGVRGWREVGVSRWREVQSEGELEFLTIMGVGGGGGGMMVSCLKEAEGELMNPIKLYTRVIATNTMAIITGVSIRFIR